MASLKLSQLYASPTNVRPAGDFSGPTFKELVTSVKGKGVLQPLLVRKKPKGKAQYEVIAGNRRMAAAAEAGLTEVPVHIVSMSDTEAREAQIIENLQRADLHPLEEGETYRALIESSRPRYTPADVAAKVGKPETFVRDRIVLTNLTADGKKRFRSGQINVGHAALLARISPAMQKAALKWLEGWNDEPATETVAEVREWIREHQHAEATTEISKLGGKALEAVYAGCEECAGKGGDLFGKKAAESCSNPKCYMLRALAYVQLQREKNPGLLLISTDYGTPQPYGPDKIMVLGKRAYIQVGVDGNKKCPNAVAAIVVEGDDIGRVKSVCVSPECKVHDTKNLSGSDYAQTPAQLAKKREARRKELAAERAKQARENQEVADAVAAIPWPITDAGMTGFLEAMIDCTGFTEAQNVCRRRGIKPPKDSYHSGALREHGATLDTAGKFRLACEILTAVRYQDTKVKHLLAISGKKTKKKGKHKFPNRRISAYTPL
jgi:ParB family chromosome partitioning protein